MGHLGAFKLLPTKPGVCQECAVNHAASEPHNAQSLTYQYRFFDQHGRWPTWADAMDHCDAATQALWRAELAKRGVPEDQLQAPAGAAP